MATPLPYPDSTKQAYLDELRKHGLRATAIRAAGMGSTTLGRWRDGDPEFAAAEQEAIQDAAEALELEARRRAYDGVDREKCIGSGDNSRFIVEKQFSDTLMLALLKANNPDKFKDRTASEISGPNGQPVQVDGVQSAARLAAILEAARHRAGGDTDPFE